jgi:hypothetical protein
MMEKWRLDKEKNLERWLQDIGANDGLGAMEGMLLRGDNLVTGMMILDPVSVRLMGLIAPWLKLVSTITPGSGPLCLGCEKEFNHTHPYPNSFFVTVPAYKDWMNEDTSALITGICRDCDSKTDEELVTIAKGYWAKAHPTIRDLGEERKA